MHQIIALAVLLASSAISYGQETKRPSEGLRSAYATMLTKGLLKRGYDISATAQDPKGEKLLIMGYAVDRVLVFNLISYGQLLETAKENGFKTILFLNQARGTPPILFDLSKPGPLPTCSSAGLSVCRE